MNFFVYRNLAYRKISVITYFIYKYEIQLCSVGETGPILDSSTTLDSSNNKVAIT